VHARACAGGLVTALALCFVVSSPASAGTTTTMAHGSPTARTVSPADKELIMAIGSETKVGSVRVSGSIVQGKTSVRFNLLVHGDGGGGGAFQQGGSRIRLERFGTLLYFDAPKQFWATHATAAQTKANGGKWIEVSALDQRFLSFVQSSVRPTSSKPSSRATATRSP
jgi:hypothetical protein